MRFKYGFTFGTIMLIFLLAGCGIAQPNNKEKSQNNQISASISTQMSSDNNKTGILSDPTSITKADENSFTSIHMVDTVIGWASTNESILRTVDGGQSWTDVTPKGINDQVIGPMFCLDGQTAWITFTQESSPKIIVYRTKDGGQNWRNIEIDRTYSTHITSLSFSDFTHGWLLASYGGACGSESVDVFKTSDGGASWKQVASANPSIPNGIPFSGDKGCLVFANQNDGWLTGGSPGPSVWLYATHDGGQTWAPQSLPIPKGYQTGGGAVGTKTPHFFVSKDGVLPVVFAGQEPPVLMLYTTHDGGISWKVTTPAKSSQEALASYRGFQWSIVDARHSIVSDGYKLYYTSDGMESFETITPNIDLKNLQQLDFVTEKIGWAIIDGGIWKTSDGGYIWTEVSWAPLFSPIGQLLGTMNFPVYLPSYLPSPYQGNKWHLNLEKSDNKFAMEIDQWTPDQTTGTGRYAGTLSGNIENHQGPPVAEQLIKESKEVQTIKLPNGIEGKEYIENQDLRAISWQNGKWSYYVAARLDNKEDCARNYASDIIKTIGVNGMAFSDSPGQLYFLYIGANHPTTEIFWQVSDSIWYQLAWQDDPSEAIKILLSMKEQ